MERDLIGKGECCQTPHNASGQRLGLSTLLSLFSTGLVEAIAGTSLLVDSVWA